MVNVLAAVVLGPWWGVSIAFAASLICNLLGLGSLMAFPGSMVGALCCGLVYAMCKKLWLTCCAEAFGTGVLGEIAAYPVAKLLMGLNPTGLFVYIVPFFVSTVVGSILAYVLISALEKGGALNQIRTERECMAADWGHHLLSRKKNVVGNKELGYPEEGEKR